MLSSVSALLVAYVTARTTLKNRPEVATRTTNALINGFIVFLVIWKLMPLVSSLRAVISQPLLLLYAPGGRAGTIAGCIGISIYMGFFFYKNRGTAIHFVKSISLAVCVFLCVFFLMAFALVLPGRSGENGSVVTTAPEFTLMTLEDKAVSLSEYRGTYVVLNFWATWCPPCRAEIPELVSFHRGLSPDVDGGSKVALLSVNQTASEKNLDTVRQFIAKYKIEFPVLLDRRNAVANQYGIRGIPTTFIIGADGSILARRSGVVSGSWIRRIIQSASD